MTPDPERSGLHQMAAALAGSTAGGTAAVIGLLYFAAGFGHGTELQWLIQRLSAQGAP
jgi:hypothetical protein